MSFATNIKPVAGNYTITHDLLDNVIEFDGTAVSLTLINNGSRDILVMLNADADAFFTLPAGFAWGYSAGDMHVTEIAMSTDLGGSGSGGSSGSGYSTSSSVTVIAGVVS